MIRSYKIEQFVEESNRIEGIQRVTDHEVDAHEQLLSMKRIAVPDLEEFVKTVAARPLRRAVGQDVRIGAHFPPPGGPQIENHLDDILVAAHGGRVSPYDVHVRYELLHPFLDGNGRSGRVLWAWQMLREGQNPFALPFLHRFYYQALDAAR